MQILSVAFSEAGDQIYTAGIENVVNVWDLRREEVSMSLAGHGDSITGMRLSPDGTHLLTNSMDNTLRCGGGSCSRCCAIPQSGMASIAAQFSRLCRVWDMRPYAPSNRCTKVFAGHVHTFEKNLLRCDWSPDGQKVGCLMDGTRVERGVLDTSTRLGSAWQSRSAGHRGQRRPVRLHLEHGQPCTHVQAAWPQRQRERVRVPP